MSGASQVTGVPTRLVGIKAYVDVSSSIEASINLIASFDGQFLGGAEVQSTVYRTTGLSGIAVGSASAQADAIRVVPANAEVISSANATASLTRIVLIDAAVVGVAAVDPSFVLVNDHLSAPKQRTTFVSSTVRTSYIKTDARMITTDLKRAA